MFTSLPSAAMNCRSVVDMFEERAASIGERPAIIMVEPSCVVTYSQLDRR